MLSPKRFLSKARNGQPSDFNTRQRKTSGKGHFVVHTADEKRFEVPLSHLNNTIFQELLKMSEDEFGLAANGRITLPCNAVFLDYILSLIRRHPSKDTEKALLLSIASDRCFISCSQQSEHYIDQMPVHAC
ncbi:hypothetical protein H6P81_019067 [Aristolochia fimbriata]|uniref:Small auxin up regulated protein n=1 Tax=Aristolochia fimbriata TaxID=158543 RepID=A0AAV7E313_ARIFI|nr:hypothetical protein H6P81_019067 [Aristolochia fimbriata]